MSFRKVLLFSFCILFFLNPLKVAALDEGFYSTISYTIGDVGVEGLEYDENQVVGEYTSNVVDYKTLEYFTEDGYKRRKHDVAERVSVPPYSTIDVGYYWYNNTPDTVDVEQIRLPVSRENVMRGDLSNIVRDEGFEQSLTFAQNIYRDGRYFDVDGVGLISSDIGTSANNGVVITSFYVIPPVEITEYEINYNERFPSQIYLHIKNNFGRGISNIRLNYKTVVDKILDFGPYEEKVLELYKHCTLDNGEVNCGSMTIYDNNTSTQCVVYGSPFDNYLTRDSISLFNRIGDQWVVGAQTQPDRESFCIQRIPYVYTTPDMVAYREPQEPEITPEEYWQELLNIPVLPITSYEFSKLNRLLTLLKPSGIDNLYIL
ncbi:MAG: hypothetical protein XD93_0884 [candidate division WS6 bacterium 34_10]|uniref:Transmembrane(S)protein n=1 Tax=candidate division WS6 bacterium 34_10 TaxID=1641389 RepID=A0A101HGK1_9BACT|nr:MAG: hypothetical protein XD93_0884 [candidate division WS6 bacterium 34_10]